MSYDPNPVNTDHVRLSDDHHVLASCIHHVISDGWSLSLMLSEVFQPRNECRLLVRRELGDCRLDLIHVAH